MPTIRLALGPDESRRMSIHGALFSATRMIMLDGVEVGRIDSFPALREGRSFTLPDGTQLRVGLDPSAPFGLGRMRVERDGVLLRDSPAHPAQDVRRAAGALAFAASVELIHALVIMIQRGPPPGAQRIGWYLGLGFAFSLVAGLSSSVVWYARLERRWALIAGFSLCVLIALSESASGTPWRCYVNLLAAAIIARGIRAHRALAILDAHSVASVFR